MDDKVFQAALAGLLHDIGKFAQRAGELGSRTWDGEAEKDYKYQHALYSGDFVEKYVPKKWRTGLSGPARHHRPQTHHDRVVALADRLSAGERADEQSSHPKQMLSIFCDIKGLTDEKDRPIPAPQNKYLPLKELKIQADTIFPVETQSDSHDTYKALWDQFENEVKISKMAYEDDQADCQTYLSNLLKLMQRYCWSIPSAYYRTRPDVGLYDHSRMTGALAACLIGRDEAVISDILNGPSSQAEIALLVGGDISGVQKFIYTITSRGATSGLRGRSMYLQLLTEVAARYVLAEIGMPLTNLIYAGGGHFYLLAPIGSRAKLRAAQERISRLLLHQHQGDLYLALGQVVLHAHEFHGSAFSARWRDLTQTLQAAKQRQFSELGAELNTLLFEPLEHGGKEEAMCMVCQREHQQTKPIKEVEEVRKCPVCLGFETLGKKLRRAQYLCLDEITPASLPPTKNSPADEWTTVLTYLGYRVSIGETQRDIAKPDSAVLRRNLLALTDEALTELKPGPQQAIGRHFLVKVTPILTPQEYTALQGKVEELPEPDSVKPFEVIAQQAVGIKRLGILRMDVDNLGQIFSEGLGEEATLSRVAALSFAISLFFEGWTEQIAGSFNQGDHDLVYSIYSGGDDLFFVGAWHLMPQLAEQISQDLQRYSGGHTGIHVSGGIVLADSKYPLYQAAAEAHAAEQTAKANRYNGSGKNTLSFLDKAIPWVKFDEVKAQQEQLLKLVNPEKGQKAAAPKSLLQRLNQLYTEYNDANQAMARKGQSEKVYWGPWHWHSAYSLGRMAEQYKQARDEIKKIRDQLSLDEFKNIEWIGLAARWAELLARKGEVIDDTSRSER